MEFTRSGTRVEPYEIQRKFRFHLLGLVHLPVSRAYMGCAFTQKIEKLSRMLLALGHEVIVYGAEGSDVPCSEFVETHTLSDIRQAWGDGDNRFVVGYDWKSEGFRHDFNTEKTDATKKYYAAAIEEINRRKRADDFLLVTQGFYQKPIADQVGIWLTCEPCVGYRGVFSRFCAYESEYLRNFVYGSKTPFASVNGNWYDRTIPNYFEERDFPFSDQKEKWFFFMGRMIERKGIGIAIDTTAALGADLLLAGQGSYPLPGHCRHVGYVGPGRRAKLLGNARAVFVPTKYMEAFGGVNVEAQLCGTPVITTDFACFTETVIHGVTGYRCNTLQDFVDAAAVVDRLDPATIRRHAERFLVQNVQWEFQKWFDDLYNLWESAFIPGVRGWSRVHG